VRAECTRDLACKGAETFPRVGFKSPVTRRVSPKSPSLRWPFSSSRMFDGLRSQYT
jgi:hypothetical protein